MNGNLNRAVVVTGASSGIGYAIAAKAAAAGAAVFAAVRSEADAANLRARLNVTPLLFDVTDEAAIRAGAEAVSAALQGRRLFGLVNNAGVAVAGPLLHLETEELRHQLDVNLLGVHRVTRAFASLLGADPARLGKSGRIVMMSSINGRVAQPFVGPYAASKFALEGYAASLRRELMAHGIDVIVVAPGAVKTPIWQKAAAADATRFDHTPYKTALANVRAFALRAGRNGLPPETAADAVWRALTVAKPKTRYVVMRNPVSGSLLPRLLPPRLVDHLAARAIGLTHDV